MTCANLMALTAFPVLKSGRLAHYPFRGLLDVYSRYGLHARQIPQRTLYTEGFNRFVTSTVAPIATGRSESCRTGIAPAERQRFGTAHLSAQLGRTFSFCPCLENFLPPTNCLLDCVTQPLEVSNVEFLVHGLTFGDSNVRLHY